MYHRDMNKEKKSIQLITKISEIPPAFHNRLYNYFLSVFDKSNKNFYSSDYYLDIIKFCSSNEIKLTIPEYLAINFYFFSQNDSLNSNLFLKEYLKTEKKEFNLKFLPTHVNRAKTIMVQLRNNTVHLPMDAALTHSINKIKDILNIYYSYSATEFEHFVKAKTHDFYLNNSFVLQLEEAYGAEILKFEKYLQKNEPIYLTQKFKSLLEPFVRENILEFISHNRAEYQRSKIFQSLAN